MLYNIKVITTLKTITLNWIKYKIPGGLNPAVGLTFIWLRGASIISTKLSNLHQTNSYRQRIIAVLNLFLFL